MNNETLIFNLTVSELKELIFECVDSELSKHSLAAQSQEQEELLTRKQTATLLRITLVTLYHWTKEGRLQSYKIGGRIRYKKDEVLTAVKEVKNLKYKRSR